MRTRRGLLSLQLRGGRGTSLQEAPQRPEHPEESGVGVRGVFFIHVLITPRTPCAGRTCRGQRVTSANILRHRGPRKPTCPGGAQPPSCGKTYLLRSEFMASEPVLPKVPRPPFHTRPPNPHIRPSTRRQKAPWLLQRRPSAKWRRMDLLLGARWSQLRTEPGRPGQVFPALGCVGRLLAPGPAPPGARWPPGNCWAAGNCLKLPRIR